MPRIITFSFQLKIISILAESAILRQRRFLKKHKGDETMGENGGKADKGNKEQKKKPKMTQKEKRKEKNEAKKKSE